MLRFTKMHGLGNDYIYLDCRKQTPEDLPALARRLSDRHFGIGADGLICIGPSNCADVSMRIFNADGSEGEMCGNGIRCVGKYVYDKGLTNKDRITVETLGGIKQVILTIEQGVVTAATVDMGEPHINCCISLIVKGRNYTVYPVSMGNPHAVIFVDQTARLDLNEIGPEFEHHPMFPNRTNTEFVQVIDRAHLNMRVWERGSGETLACGTGACAAFSVCAYLGLCEREATVHLLGGDLYIQWSEEDGHIYMTGPATTVYEGVLSV